MTDPLFHYLAQEMLEAHATEEWVAHLVYQRFYSRSPSPAVRKVLQEELAHYRLLAGIHPNGPAHLKRIVRKKLKGLRLPALGSQLEFHVASWIFDYAGLLQIEGLTKCAWKPYRSVALKILRDEAEHEHHGFESLRAALISNPKLRGKVRALGEKWLSFALLAFGSAGSPFDLLSVRLGLKQKSSLHQKRRFERVVRARLARLLK